MAECDALEVPPEPEEELYCVGGTGDTQELSGCSPEQWKSFFLTENVYLRIPGLQHRNNLFALVQNYALALTMTIEQLQAPGSVGICSSMFSYQILSRHEDFTTERMRQLLMIIWSYYIKYTVIVQKTEIKMSRIEWLN